MNPMTATEVARLWTADDVAAFLGVKRWRVLALARGHAFPAVRMGRDIRFRREDIEAWVDEQAARERDRLSVQGGRPKEAVGRKRDRRLDARGKADPKGALRIVPDGGVPDAA